jgi:CRISPR system Cascade subunit CasA
MLNLITDRWLPVRRASGLAAVISPCELTQGLDDDPIVRLDAPRLDFNAALAQFLIGLLQTLSPPEDEDAWREWRERESPPAPEILQRHFVPYAPYFELAGDGARFMQDYDLAEGEPKSVGALLIDAPGAKAERDNTDHFVKRGYVCGLSPACAAMALLTLQTNAPGGGVGHRTSLRGGGPLTTLVMPASHGQPLSLWELLWWNVLSQPDFLNDWPGPNTPEALFPWAGPIKTSDAKSGYVYAPANTHPAHAYWATPRRIRLDFRHTESGLCSLSGEPHETLVTRYLTKNYGANYVGWKHPLSPHYYDKDKQPLPLHAQPGGMTYRHWPGLAATKADANGEPARVVSQFGRRAGTGDSAQLWTFGYDMDNMKPRCWYESVMPLHAVPGMWREAFHDFTRRLVGAAELCAVYLRTALRQAWFGPEEKVDTTKLAYLDVAFWHDTEAGFYRLLQQAAAACRSAGLALEQRQALSLRWYLDLRDHTRHSFDHHAHAGAWEHENAERIALAQIELQKKLNGKKLRIETLDLPKIQPKDEGNEDMEKGNTP